MRLLLSFLLCLSANAALVPFYNDASYERDEPVSPPWFVFNTGLPSHLYHDGVYVSEETGTNDLGLLTAQAMQPIGCRIGIVGTVTHTERCFALVHLVSPSSLVFLAQTVRSDPSYIAAGIVGCVTNGCRVVVVPYGWTVAYESVSNACATALASNVVLLCSTPNEPGDLDGDMVDYPYAWRFPNVLGVSATDRNGQPYWSGTGTNSIGAPGRNIVAAGVYSSGTSWACPIVAGCVALLIERYPGQSAEAYIAAVKLSAIEGRINPVGMLEAPRPTVSIRSDGPFIIGLPGWRYELQHSDDLGQWHTVQEGFWRAKAL
jgi:hypothetical protein